MELPDIWNILVLEPYKHLGAGIYTKCSTLLCIGSAKVFAAFVIGVLLDRYVTHHYISLIFIVCKKGDCHKKTNLNHL